MTLVIPHRQPYVPVITGGGLGSYSLAREFHELDGSLSAIVPTAMNRHFAGTSLGAVLPAGQMHEPAQVLEALEEASVRFGGHSRPLVLLPSFDHHVQISVEHSQELEKMGFVLPAITPEQISTAGSKENFYAVCDELGLPYPRTEIFSCANAAGSGSIEDYVHEQVSLIIEDGALTFPLIVKASDGGAWANIAFPGRRKVFVVRNQEELRRVLLKVVDAGYRGGLVLQEYIGGPDNHLRILTQFRNRTGTISLSAYGEVVVEDHAPGMEGNARAVITSQGDDVASQGAQILDHLDWHGFAMFDLKVDPVSGRTFFLEMNPRIGQHHFYLTLAGANPARWLVEELIGDGAAEEAFHLSSPAFSTTIPISLAKRFASAEQLRLIKTSRRTGRSGNPWKYRADRRIAHRLYLTYRAYRSRAEVTKPESRAL